MEKVYCSECRFFGSGFFVVENEKKRDCYDVCLITLESFKVDTWYLRKVKKIYSQEEYMCFNPEHLNANNKCINYARRK